MANRNLLSFLEDSDFNKKSKKIKSTNTTQRKHCVEEDVRKCLEGKSAIGIRAGLLLGSVSHFQYVFTLYFSGKAELYLSLQLESLCQYF